ncbi:MAG: YceD family protein [Ignavibacteriales bacterium]
MKISVGDLTKGISEQKEIDLIETIEDFEIAGDEIKLNAPVKIKGAIKKDSGILKLDGTIDFGFELKCHRCLKELKKDFCLRISETFSNAVDIPEDSFRFEGNEIDLSEMVSNVIITNIPMKVLCSEECKGLCSSCGSNLNIEKCSCTHEEYDSRMEKLLELKNKLK